MADLKSKVKAPCGSVCASHHSCLRCWWVYSACVSMPSVRIIPRYFADKACMWLSRCFTQNGNSRKKEGEKRHPALLLWTWGIVLWGASECDGEFQLVRYTLFSSQLVKPPVVCNKCSVFYIQLRLQFKKVQCKINISSKHLTDQCVFLQFV